MEEWSSGPLEGFSGSPWDPVHGCSCLLGSLLEPRVDVGGCDV